MSDHLHTENGGCYCVACQRPPVAEAVSELLRDTARVLAAIANHEATARAQHLARRRALVLDAWADHAPGCRTCRMVLDQPDVRTASLDGFCAVGRALAFLALRRTARVAEEVP